MGILTWLKKRPAMPALQFYHDRQIHDVSLEVRDTYLVNNKASKAWGLSPDDLIRFRGKFTQLITDTDCSPVSLTGTGKNIEDFDSIISQAYGMALLKMKSETGRGSQGNIVFTAVLILSLTVVLLVLAGLIHSGTFHMPAMPF